jgi:hypothetical protein
MKGSKPMPKRPRQHVIEDLARVDLHYSFSNVGWTVENLDKDYGEDLFVRIFEDGKATPWSFFVQSKATDKLNQLLTKNGQNVAFSITSGHAQHWERFGGEPVVLAIYDTKAKKTYWEVIQSDLESTQELSVGRPRKFLTVHVPTDNLLDEEGLRRLRNRTKRRFERFEAQREGVQVLIDELRQKWGVTIEYEPEFGLLMLPKGKFKAEESGGHTLTAFGCFAAHLQQIEEKYGITPQRTIEKSIELMYKIVSTYKQGGKLQIRGHGGELIQEWEALEELQRHANRQEELNEE